MSFSDSARPPVNERIAKMLFERSVPKINFLNAEIPEPRVLIDFLGFEKHLVQIREKRGATIWPLWYDHAAYYSIDLPPEKIFGPGDEVRVPDFVKAADYEFELGCIIGESALITDEKEALQFFKEKCHLTILNDWSARDVQKVDMAGLGPTNSKFILGKSLGPNLIPAGELKMDENGVLDMQMVAKVNGEERCNSNYNTLYHTHPQTKKKAAWSFPRLITFLGRQNIAVHPGYVLGSGTVGNGCIAEFSAKMNAETGEVIEPAKYPWLKDGDVVTLEAKGIGKLENKIRVTSKTYAGVK